MNQVTLVTSSKQPKTPDVLRRFVRIVECYERSSAITQYVKRTRGTTCQLCGEIGFIKKNGERYCEAHHLFHLSTNPPADFLSHQYLVVLCANCHRRMHYADIGEPVRDGDGWIVRVDEKQHFFPIDKK